MIKKMRWGFFTFLFISFSFLWADYQLRLKKIVHPSNENSQMATRAPQNGESTNALSANTANNPNVATTSKNSGSLEVIKAELENPKDLKAVAKTLSAGQIKYLAEQLTSDSSSMERKALSLELLSNNDSDLSHKGLRDYLDHARVKHDEASLMLKLQAQDALNNRAGTIE